MMHAEMDMTGKSCMITGATSGIGEVTALALAERGAELFLVCRNQEKGEATKEKILRQTGTDRITLLIGDLASLAEVRQVAQSFLQLDKPLHLLLNNAGIFNLKREVTIDGYEAMFAVNHLAHFLLTNLLLARIKESSSARIVTVASDAHILIKGMQFEDLGFAENFSALKVYSHSKLANILFTRELAKRLEGTGVSANSVHPGAVSTGLGKQNGWVGRFLNMLMQLFLISREKGARTSIHVCTSSELDGISGRHFANSREEQPKPWAMDDVAARTLWEVSEEMVGLPQ